jgi:antitoxin PrlF
MKSEFGFATMASLKTKVNSEGSITLPDEVQEALRIRPGSSVDFVEIAPGRYEIVAVSRSIREVKGMFGAFPRAVSIEEMNSAIEKCGAGIRD